MTRQKLYGLGLLLIGLALPLLDGGDITATAVLGPLGAWMLCSRRCLLYTPAQKKSAPAAATVDAPNTQGAVRVDISSIAQSGGECND